MADKPLAARLQIRAKHKVLVLHAPAGFALDDLPDGVIVAVGTEPKPEATYDVVLVFAGSISEAHQRAPGAWRALKGDGVYWLAYPKKSGAIQTDIDRESAWDVMQQYGLGAVAQISVDATWSALRFRREADIQRKGKG
jgi:hypothetical protein